MTTHFDHRSPHVVVFTGNAHRPSRSRGLGEYVAERLAAEMPVRTSIFDVVDAGPGLGAAFTREQLTPEARRVIEAVESADGLIAITPVYKGSFTGLFKHLFDFVGPLALIDKPVLIGATGGGHRHALMVEHQLRPLFGFFSALTVPTSVYAAENEMTNGVPTDPALVARIAQAARQMAMLLHGKGAIEAASTAVIRKAQFF